MSELLSLEEAQAQLLALAPDQPVVSTSDLDPYARYLAEDIIARRTQPSADLSAMDGYAICGDGPWRRIGESRAGAPYDGGLEPGQCTRISTGAQMPQGTDRVLIQENAVIDGDIVALAPGMSRPEAGRHVRAEGFDFREGDTVLTAGTRIDPAQLALSIAAGHDQLRCRPPPSVQVLDSGDELAVTAAQAGFNQIPATNSAMIAAMLRPYVGMVDRLGPVPDSEQALAQALARADGHILITSGGASVGDHDLIQQALLDWGADLSFWKVAIKPGKPLMVATKQREWGKQVILGLPGNPVSSFVTCFLFALPLVRAAMGDTTPLPRPATLKAAHDLQPVGKRREFLRAVGDGASVRLAASQDSSALRALASANCLIDRPAGAPMVSAGEPVPVYNLQNG